MIQGDGAFYEDISYKWRNGGTWHPLESLVAVSIQATKPIVSSILNDNNILDPVFLLTSKIESSGFCVFWWQSSPWGWWRWGRTWWSCFRRRPAHPPGNLPPVEVVCWWIDGKQEQRERWHTKLCNTSYENAKNILYLVAFLFRSQIRSVHTVETSITHCQTLTISYNCTI